MGEVTLAGFRQGVGILLYKSSRVYEGEWATDLREGKGYEMYQNGNIYVGEFSRGKA